MKPLDKNKKYDLSKLNDEQLQAVLDWLKESDTNWTEDRIQLLIKHKNICFYHYNWVVWHEYTDLTNALELFDEELPLKGFVALKTELPKNIDFKKELPNITFTQDEEKPNSRNILEELNTHHLQWDENRKGFFWTERPDYIERLREYRQQKTIENLAINSGLKLEDCKTQENIYESAHDLIEKGKQHGLKIVVTFEKL